MHEDCPEWDLFHHRNWQIEILQDLDWFNDRNEDVKWTRKIAQDKFELTDFKVEELLGEVKKSKMFNDTDIDDAVIDVSRIMEKQLDIYKTSHTQLVNGMIWTWRLCMVRLKYIYRLTSHSRIIFDDIWKEYFTFTDCKPNDLVAVYGTTVPSRFTYS